MSWGVSPWVYPVWDSLGFLDLGDYFLPHFRDVFNYYLLKYFLMVFLFVFFFWDSYDSNVVVFNIVLEVSEIVFISFNSFFIFFSDSLISTILSSTSLILSSASIIILFAPSRVFLISFIEKGTLLHCWWECKLLQPLWRIVWRFLKKLEIELPYDPEIPLLGIHTEETRIERDTCTPLFIAALLIIARTWKQPRCPSADEWIRKLWYIYTMEYYLAIKKNTFESVLMR